MWTVDTWIYIIIMIIAGAWTGYITNDVALKMLFKEYGIGRFKFGGVIVRTRKDLEKNLALLVEKEIINHNTLKSQFHKKELKNAISATVCSFFNESIFKNSKNIKVADLPGFDETVDNVLGFLKNYLENNLAKTFTDMSKNVSLGDVVSSEQAYNLSVSFTKEIIKIIESNHVIVKLIKDLYDNYHDISLDMIVGEDITSIIINNLNELLNNIFMEMRYKNDRDIQTLISKLYRDLDFDSFVEMFESYLGEKKLNYFINDNSLSKLYDLFTNYLKDNNSKESVEVFCEGLLIALKKIDKPIIDLFSGDLRLEVEKFLENQLPGIIDKLIEIVKRNSNEIEQLIEVSIDQTIYDQQTIKRIILSAIRMFLIENFTQKYDIINKIVEMLKGIDIEDLSKTISVQVVDLLHQKSISSIINELESNNILSAKIISSQVHRILNFLCERYLSKDIEHTDFLNKTVNQLFKLNLKPFINNLTVSVLTKQIIYNEDVFKFVKKEISSSLKSITKMPIDTFIVSTRVVEYGEKVQNGIAKQLHKNYDEIIEIVYKHFNHYLENNNLGELVKKNENVTFKSEAIVEVIIKSLRNLLLDNSDYRIHDLFNQVNSIDNLSENVVNAIMEFLDNGLSNVLEGNIARVVEDNIKSLSNEEVLDMMQKFMGTKLKPLTILGAILGAFVGIGIGFLTPPTVLNFTHIPTLLINFGVFGIVGYLTNVIAIYFVFRPYKPIFGFKSFQGIIPKQIPVLATAMGEVVAKNLLSEESINNMILNNEKKLKSEFIRNIQKDDYKVLKTYLTENSGSIVKQSTNYIFKYLSDNNLMLASKLTDELIKFDISKIDTTFLVEAFSKLFALKVNDSSELIANYIFNKLKSSKTLRELSLDLNVNTVEAKINGIVENQIGKFIEMFGNKDFLSQIIKNNNEKIDGVIAKDINSVLPDTTKLGIENFLYNLVSSYLYSRDKQRSLSNYIITEITSILNNNDSIDELFGGRFIELINFNMTTILEKIEETVKNWLNSYKDDINESVTRKVYDELTVVQQVGYKAINGDKLIKETVYRIVEDKLPDFIGRKIDSLTNEFNNFFDNFGKIRLKDAKLELRKDELQNYLTEVFESKEIEIKTRRFIHVVMTYFYEFKTNKVFDILGIKSSNDIIVRFNDLFSYLNNGIYKTLRDRNDKIVFDVSLLINKFITKEIMANRVRNLTLGIDKKDVDKVVNNLLNLINKNDFITNNMNDLVTIVFEHFKKIPLNELLDELFLKQDMRKLLKKLSIDYEFEKVVYNATYELFGITINEFNNLVTDELKEKILRDIIDSAYDVISNNLVDILKAVDFKEVTIREINGMDAKQIKELFDSIASKYFRKLELYGLFGGIFAIDMVLVVAVMYYAITYRKENDLK